jgi:hypothetical protein
MGLKLETRAVFGHRLLHWIKARKAVWLVMKLPLLRPGTSDNVEDDTGM